MSSRCSRDDRRLAPRRRFRLWFISLVVLTISNVANKVDGKFEPYQNNGGLVSGVAGRDYVLLASDTRLSQDYKLLSRRHRDGRLWGVSADDRSEPEIGEIIRRRGDDPPTFVGSGGCAADCEALRRRVVAEIKAATRNHLLSSASSTSTTTTTTDRWTPKRVAVLLSNVLYERRHFPFYSFCVAAGVSDDDDDGDGDGGIGEVYVYDAIGSRERVAVASAGTGREALQPILDRLFRTSNLRQEEEEGKAARDPDAPSPRDRNAVPYSSQRRGNELVPPVKTHVDCDVEEAVTHIVRGYESVAEREIGVGDEVVVWILKKVDDAGNETYHFERRSFPLKEH